MALVELLPLGLGGENLSELNQQVKGLEPLVAFLFHLAREGVVPEILRFFVLRLLHAEGKAEREIFRAVWPLINVLNENVFDVLNK
jgi:hypothetical protein